MCVFRSLPEWHITHTHAAHTGNKVLLLLSHCNMFAMSVFITVLCGAEEAKTCSPWQRLHLHHTHTYVGARTVAAAPPGSLNVMNCNIKLTEKQGRRFFNIAAGELGPNMEAATQREKNIVFVCRNWCYFFFFEKKLGNGEATQSIYPHLEINYWIEDLRIRCNSTETGLIISRVQFQTFWFPNQTSIKWTLGKVSVFDLCQDPEGSFSDEPRSSGQCLQSYSWQSLWRSRMTRHLLTACPKALLVANIRPFQFVPVNRRTVNIQRSSRCFWLERKLNSELLQGNSHSHVLCGPPCVDSLGLTAMIVTFGSIISRTHDSNVWFYSQPLTLQLL